MVRLEPWQQASAAEMAALYDAQADIWRRTLGWETGATWPGLDAARRLGRADGAIARADGRVAGWTYWIARGDELQCGGLVASTPVITDALTGALVASAAAAGASRIVLFTYPPAPGLHDALAGRGFAVEPYDYLVRGLDTPAGQPAAVVPLRPWDLRDLAATAALLEHSYGPDPQRPFAAAGTPAAWRDYVRDLTLGAGCGRPRPSLSRVAGALRPEGVALVTEVGDGTAHLAQLAVEPAARGRGVARRLLSATIEAARHGRFARLTLLVSRSNAGARRLYAAEGFVTAAEFTAATRGPAGAISRADRRATPGPAAA